MGIHNLANLIEGVAKNYIADVIDYRLVGYLT
jgi:hypothetical protein